MAYVKVEELREALYESDTITFKGLAIIDNFSTADVVEVVRCKDCVKGFERNENSKLDIYWCNKWKNIMRGCDFCSYGEKK